MNLAFSDTGETFAVTVENAVLHHRMSELAAAPTITLTRATLTELVLGQTTVEAAIDAKAVTAPLGAEPLASLLYLLDRFDFWFEIVTP
jgi:alkyl sulfatase BDS1-like metallo-beta-lactamase superfamily hydrolase